MNTKKDNNLTDQLTKAIALSKEMETLADDGQWEEINKITQQRQSLLELFFNNIPHHYTEKMIRDGISQIKLCDDSIQLKISEERFNAAQSLQHLRKGSKAAKHYNEIDKCK